MWNLFNTGDYSGMIAQTIKIKGFNDEQISAYYAKPLNKVNVPGVVLIPHMPGWDEWCFETTRRFAQQGYACICPDIYSRFGTGTPSEVSLKAREAGGVKDESVMGDVKACRDFLVSEEESNNKTGVIGMCSGGRHAFLAACQLDCFDAAVDCWGGGVIMKDDQLSEARPVSPITLVEDLSCPLLGIFGNDDKHPDVEEVNKTEQELIKHQKSYEFYRYDNAGHGIWYYDKPMYAQQQAMDSWDKTIAFFDKHLK